MIDIGSIVALFSKALDLGNKLRNATKNRHSKEEKELLIAAADEGQFHLFDLGQLGITFVRVGRKDFYNEKDPAIAAVYLEALNILLERGLVMHQSGILFVLTGKGFKKAREMTKHPAVFSWFKKGRDYKRP